MIFLFREMNLLHLVAKLCSLVENQPVLKISAVPKIKQFLIQNRETNLISAVIFSNSNLQQHIVSLWCAGVHHCVSLPPLPAALDGRCTVLSSLGGIF